MADFQTINELAYDLWVKGGRREGTAEHNWLEAERILASRTAASSEAPARAPLTANAVDQLLTAPAPARTRGRKSAQASAKSSVAAAARTSRESPSAETPKVGSRDAPGG